MEPVVNGIEEKYFDDVEVMRLNANQGKGQEAFRFYRLQGHPSFVLLDFQGNITWSGLGVQTADTLEAQIEKQLVTP
ncbi:MAG: hypothetical protein H8D34_16565 [Chloroflexi bacterium]|nr:hypothetical protein [Chloroflexota bacterium]MBL7164225.1 hypothetical protein [Anaerolineales bacterium]